MLITSDTYFPEKWNLTSDNLGFRGAIVVRTTANMLFSTLYLLPK